jgi:hypothetical protein
MKTRRSHRPSPGEFKAVFAVLSPINRTSSGRSGGRKSEVGPSRQARQHLPVAGYGPRGRPASPVWSVAWQISP